MLGDLVGEQVARTAAQRAALSVLLPEVDGEVAPDTAGARVRDGVAVLRRNHRFDATSAIGEPGAGRAGRGRRRRARGAARRRRGRAWSRWPTTPSRRRPTWPGCGPTSGPGATRCTRRRCAATRRRPCRPSSSTGCCARTGSGRAACSAGDSSPPPGSRSTTPSPGVRTAGTWASRCW
nr:hypothetical protein [Angustibacter aerolatus]